MRRKSSFLYIFICLFTKEIRHPIPSPNTKTIGLPSMSEMFPYGVLPLDRTSHIRTPIAEEGEKKE